MNITVYLQVTRIPCFTWNDRHTRQLQDAFPHATITVCHSREALKEALPETTHAIVWRLSQEEVDRAHNLQALITPAAGTDYMHITVPAHVTQIHGSFHGELMAETVVGMMLMHARGLYTTARLQQVEDWPVDALAASMKPLRGSSVTILGFGHIGQWIARLLIPFGVHLRGINRRARPLPEGMPDSWETLGLSDLGACLPHTDHLVLVLPSGKETDNLIRAEQLACLPDHAALYNVGRGNAIDETALVRALQSKRLAAAYLDVFQQEPLPAESPLRHCPTAFLMPHASAFSPNYLDCFVRELIPRLQPS